MSKGFGDSAPVFAIGPKGAGFEIRHYANTTEAAEKHGVQRQTIARKIREGSTIHSGWAFDYECDEVAK